NVVVTKPRPWRDARHVIDADPVHHGSLARYSSRNAGSVCSVILDRLRIEVVLVILVKENLRYDNFSRDVLAVLILVIRSAISLVALWKTVRIAKSGWVKERMCMVNTRIDVADLDPGACRRSAAGGSPGVRRVDDLIALAQDRMVKHVVFGALHHWCGCDCRQ